MPKVIAPGVKLTLGATPEPVKDRLIFPCDETMVNEPFAAPVAVGAKLTVMVHVVPLAKVFPHVLVCGNAGTEVMFEIVTAPIRLLLNVTV